MRGPFPERRTAKPTDVGPLVRNVPPPTSSTGGVGVFGRGSRGYPAEVSESGKRSLMQVQPTRLVELAAASETVLDAMRQDWAGAAAAGLLGRRSAKSSASGTPPLGGMGAGAMAARAGTMSRGMASGRGGPSRMATPRLERTSSEEAAARAARDKDAVRDAKRAALEEKRAERAARKAEREAERQAAREKDKRGAGKDEAEERDDLAPVADLEADDEAAGETEPQPGSGDATEAEAPAIRIVHEPTPGGQHGGSRR